tara:strand:+ start:348 stop:983 length:636 start_codon:yes stop_codon:yes gene_type:complete
MRKNITSVKVLERIGKLREEGRLTQWENGFLESLTESFSKYRGLTPRQYEVFEKIEKKYNDPTAIKEWGKWIKEYDDEKRNVAKIVAEYYIAENQRNNTGYWGDLPSKILNDDKFIPTRNQFDKMTGNNYAKRAIAAASEKAKFPVGSIARIRQSISYTHRCARYPNEDVLILSVLEDGRQYKTSQACLLSNPAEIFEIQQRHLKKSPANK